MALPITGIGIEYSVQGLEVLGQAVKTTDDLLASTNSLITSVKSLNDALLSVNPNLATATAGMKEYTLATAGAAKASADAATASRANARAVEAAGAAYAKAAASVAAYQAAVSASSGATVGAGFAAGAVGGMAGAAAARTAAAAAGAGVVSSAIAPITAENGAASLATAAGVNAIGGVQPMALRGSRAFATANATLSTIPPVTGYAYRMPGGSGSNEPIESDPSSGGGGRRRGNGGGVPSIIGGGLAGAAIHGAMLAGEIDLGAAVDAVYNAGKLQTLMFGIKNSTGATDAQIKQLQESAYRIGDVTGLSAVESAHGMVNIARASGGVFRNKDGSFDMAGLNAIVPTVMEAAQIQHITRGTPTDEAATNLMETVHLFRDFRGTKFTDLADMLTRLSEMMPQSLHAANKQFTYFEPQFKAMGISDMDAMATFAMLARAGYGTGKGGTNVNQLVAAALPALELTGHAQAGKLKLLEKYGFVDRQGKSEFFTNDKADLMGFFHHISDLSKDYKRDDLVSAMKDMFGVQGGRIGNLVGDPQIAAQIAAIEEIMRNKNISLPEQFRGYQGQLNFQSERAFKNAESLLTEIGTQAIPGVTKAMRDLGNTFSYARSWMSKNGALEVQIQRDIKNAVKGTEDFIGSNKQTWTTLGDDIHMVYKDLRNLNPNMKDLGSTLSTVAGITDTFIKDMDAVGNAFNTINNLSNKFGHVDWSWLNGKLVQMPTPIKGSQLGSAPLDLPGPQPGRPGPTIVTLHQHFHGPAHPRVVSSAATAGVRAAMNNSGHQVTSPGLPAALTIGGK